MTNKLISIVIPVYNEEKNIDRLKAELVDVLDAFGMNYELVCVDDGSAKDNTWEALKRLRELDPTRIKIYRHSRNFGLSGAYQTGFDRTKGDYVVVYASDLETPARYIKDVVEKLEAGYDVVNTNRVGRWNSSLLRRFPSSVANLLISKVTDTRFKDNGSGLKGFRRFVVENLNMHGEMHRFCAAYSAVFTKKIIEFDVEYHERTYGKSAYGSIWRTFSVILDLFTVKFMMSFATKPFTMMPGRIFGTTGLVSFLLGSGTLVYLFVLKIFLAQSIGNRPLLIVGVLLVVLGVQLIMTGLLGELLMRIYFDSRNTRPYIVAEALD
ncbi:glycosyltransferase family 2 protein [candidate division WWE3 bacterium]|nr:glycosyltransferase family 2 protein [candidate division WWE3 bacterium]